MPIITPSIRAVSKSTLTPLLTRSYASTTTPKVLLFLEHRNDSIVPATLNAITAAKKLGGTVTGLVVGESDSTQGVIDKAKK